jgi:hypothetical protein
LVVGLAGDQQSHQGHGADDQGDYHDGVKGTEFALLLA